MPTYMYRREDGTTFEVEQRITEPALEHCPDTGQKVNRLISKNAGLIFKGSGFYLTDYARKSGGDGAKETGSSDKAESKSTSPDSGSKPESSSSKETKAA